MLYVLGSANFWSLPKSRLSLNKFNPGPIEIDLEKLEKEDLDCLILSIEGGLIKEGSSFIKKTPLEELLSIKDPFEFRQRVLSYKSCGQVKFLKSLLEKAEELNRQSDVEFLKKTLKTGMLEFSLDKVLTYKEELFDEPKDS